MEGQLAVHLPGTDPEEPAKLTGREILNMNKRKREEQTHFKEVSQTKTCQFSQFDNIATKFRVYLSKYFQQLVRHRIFVWSS